MPARARSLRSLAINPKRTMSPGPPSPTFSETTNASAMHFGPNGPDKIITRGDLKASVHAYEDVSRRFVATSLLAVSLLPTAESLRSFSASVQLIGKHSCSCLKLPPGLQTLWSRVHRMFAFLLLYDYILRVNIRLKGPNYEAGTRMQAASGLHHLMSNHWHVLVNHSF